MLAADLNQRSRRIGQFENEFRKQEEVEEVEVRRRNTGDFMGLL